MTDAELSKLRMCLDIHVVLTGQQFSSLLARLEAAEVLLDDLDDCDAIRDCPADSIQNAYSAWRKLRMGDL